MVKRKDDEPVMRVLIQLAEEHNELTESMVNMIGKTNQMAAKRTASADLRTTLAKERTELEREQTGFSQRAPNLRNRGRISQSIERSWLASALKWLISEPALPTNGPPSLVNELSWRSGAQAILKSEPTWRRRGII